MITTTLQPSSHVKSHRETLHTAHEVIDTEIQALLSMKQNISSTFEEACTLMLPCQGRVIVTGMGKSGHIAHKIAATLASTGTPAFFVHPGEANHGDMGMITQQDIVLALSHSGETQEVLSLLPRIKSLTVPMIVMTGRSTSTLAQAAAVVLNTSVPQEACPLGLAPTASTTNCLVLGDALAISLLKARGFTSEDFARAHPGGHLGKRLLTRIQDVMHIGEAIPWVFPNQTLAQALLEMTHKRLGITCVIDPLSKKLLGVFTDGDLRRALDRGTDLHATQITEVMTTSALTTAPNMLATDALKMMQEHRITVLVVTDAEGLTIGIVHLHDVLPIGVDPLV